MKNKSRQSGRASHSVGETGFYSLTSGEQIGFLTHAVNRAKVWQDASAELKRGCYTCPQYRGLICGDFCDFLTRKGQKFVNTLLAIASGRGKIKPEDLASA